MWIVPLMPRSQGDLTLPVRLPAGAHDRRKSFVAGEEKKGVVCSLFQLYFNCEEGDLHLDFRI
jgi:hypothetical protein